MNDLSSNIFSYSSYTIATYLSRSLGVFFSERIDGILKYLNYLTV